jgi:hypothetical protein
MLSLLTCAAQEGINGEATYISSSVPGALGTYPMSINASMTVTGFYYVADVTPTGVRGFVRDADGTITTAPHSISTDKAGDVAGSYTDAGGVEHGFVRNPYGTLTTFDPPEGNQTTATSIADGRAVAGFYHYYAEADPGGLYPRIATLTTGTQQAARRNY